MTTVSKKAVSVVSYGQDRRTVELIWKGQTYHCKRQKDGTYVGGRMVTGAFTREIVVDLS